MQAIAWHRTSGAQHCDSPPEIREDTDAVVRTFAREGQDLDGVVVEVGGEMCSFEVGGFVTLVDSAGNRCCSSSLWGPTEFIQDDKSGHLLRVPLAGFNLFPAHLLSVS